MSQLLSTSIHTTFSLHRKPWLIWVSLSCSLSLFLSDTDPRVLEKQEQQQPTYLALSYINRYTHIHTHACKQRKLPVHRGQHCSTSESVFFVCECAHMWLAESSSNDWCLPIDTAVTHPQTSTENHTRQSLPTMCAADSTAEGTISRLWHACVFVWWTDVLHPT